MTRERMVVPTQWRQQEQHRRSESEMDIDLSGVGEKLLPVTQNFEKSYTQTGQFEVWHGRKDRNILG